MDADTVALYYFVLPVYRLVTLCCGWCCWYHFKNSNDEDKMLNLCLAVTGLNLLCLYRVISYHSNPARNNGILPGLNMLEIMLDAMINVFQTFVFSATIVSESAFLSYTGRIGCINLANYYFVCCCEVGSVLQIVCFCRNIFGYDGDMRQDQCSKIWSFVGLCMSFPGFIAFLPFFDQKYQFCQGM